MGAFVGFPVYGSGGLVSANTIGIAATVGPFVEVVVTSVVVVVNVENPVVEKSSVVVVPHSIAVESVVAARNGTVV